MIPKKIHYCWFGGNPIPEKDRLCIESWKKFCPDYEIVCWDESNYDVTKNRYMKEAYEAKKWGFVPDFGRLDIVYEHGGIYLDTDVELLRPLDDLLDQKGFMAFEGGTHVSPGLIIGAEPKHETLKQIMDSIYGNRPFKREDGTLDLTPSPQMNTEFFLSRGLIQNDFRQTVAGFTIYPSEYFCPKSAYLGTMNLTENTYSIHHFNASWRTEKQKKWYAFTARLRQKGGLAKKLAASRAMGVLGHLYYEGLKGTLNYARQVLRQRNKDSNGA